MIELHTASRKRLATARAGLLLSGIKQAPDLDLVEAQSEASIVSGGLL